jgi:hypothetical protein
MLARPTAVNVCTSPVKIVTQKAAIYTVTNGLIVGGTAAQFLTNTCLQPSIPYYAQMFDNTHRMVYADNWYFPVLSVSNIDVGTLQDAAIAAVGQTNSTATPIIVAIPSPIVGSPGGQQTITQPGSTQLVVNNLTVTNLTVSGTLTLASLTVGTLAVTTLNSTTVNSTNINLTGTLSLTGAHGLIGLATTPTGSCSTAGLWQPTNTGNWTYCNGSTLVTYSTGNLGDWTDAGIANGYIPEWNSSTGKWTPHSAPSGSFSAGGDLAGSSTVQEVTGLLSHALPSLAAGYLNYTGSVYAFTPLLTSTLGDWTDAGIANAYIPAWNVSTGKWTPVPNPAGAVPQSVTITVGPQAGSGATAVCETVCNSFHGDIRVTAGAGATTGDWVKVSWSTALSSRADPVLTPILNGSILPSVESVDGPNTNTTQFVEYMSLSAPPGAIEFTYIIQPQQ